MYRFNFDLQPAKELDATGNLMYLTISLINSLTNKPVNLVKPVLESIEQLDWFIENETAIKNNSCPLDFDDKCSVAEGLHQLYDQVDSDSFDDLEKLYEFRASHAIWFAFRGQDLPDIFIALNNNQHEVSCSDDNSKYKYEVDINSLFDEVSKSKKAFTKYIT